MKIILLFTAFLLSNFFPHAFACRSSDENPKTFSTSNIASEPIEDDNPKVGFESLPEEIIIQIFSFLNQRDIPPVSSVSQKWYALMQDPQLWRGYTKRALQTEYLAPRTLEESKDLLKEHMKFSFKYELSRGHRDLDNLHLSEDGSTVVGTMPIDRTKINSEGQNYIQEISKAFLWQPMVDTLILDNIDSETETWIVGLSADGSVVAGQERSTDGLFVRSFYYTREEGRCFLPTSMRGERSFINGLSADGFVIVGHINDSRNGNHPSYLYTRKGGMQPLSDLNGGHTMPLALSADGSLIVGEAKDGADEAAHPKKTVYWTRKGDTNSLEILINTTEYSNVIPMVSADGSVIVVNSDDYPAREKTRTATFCRLGEKMHAFETLNGGGLMINALSPDGSMAVGWAEDGGTIVGRSPSRAALWHLNRDTQHLKLLDNANNEVESSNFAYAINADGSRIAGGAGDDTEGRLRAALWDSEGKIQLVEELLSEKGILPLGWTLEWVEKLSANGNVLLGLGSYQTQEQDGTSSKIQPFVWHAVIPQGNLF